MIYPLLPVLIITDPNFLHLPSPGYLVSAFYPNVLYCAGGKIETNEMGRACGAYGGG